MSTFISRFEEVAELVPYYNLRNLVETGIGTELDKGGLAVAELLSLRAYSCDIVPARWNAARARYADAILGLMRSTDFLEQMGPRIHGPTFWWLDAHLGDEEPIWPLWDDLQLLKGRERDIIWCDDIQHIADPLNPACKGQRVGYTRADGSEWPGDTQHTLAEYIACLSETHDAVVDSTVLKFRPKPIA
jgi:hypothetical protein